MMQINTHYPLADQILSTYVDVIGKDFDGYRNHVTRMLNYCHFLMPDYTEQDSQKWQIAAAFHDIALWTHDRVDYLVPSYEVCNAYLQEQNKKAWQHEIQVIIDMHHLITPYKGPHQRLVEVFRQADLIDFSWGLIKNGVDRQFIQAVKSALPNAGFHACLGRFTLKQLARNPLRPAPMMRVKNIYRDSPK